MDVSASRRTRVIVAATVAVLALALIVTPAAAEPRSATENVRTAYDAVVLRPLGLVQVVVGVVFFVPAFPIAALFGAGDDAFRICIEQPVDRTFRRPLGEL